MVHDQLGVAGKGPAIAGIQVLDVVGPHHQFLVPGSAGDFALQAAVDPDQRAGDVELEVAEAVVHDPHHRGGEAIPDIHHRGRHQGVVQDDPLGVEVVGADQDPAADAVDPGQLALVADHRDLAEPIAESTTSAWFTWTRIPSRLS